jgi:hypothetical protein
VGSRCSIAVTEASTKPSNNRLMFSVSRRFSIATAAWAANDLASSTFASSNGTTSIFITAVTVASGIERLRRFKSWNTPIVSPGSLRGTARLERDRRNCLSNEGSKRQGPWAEDRRRPGGSGAAHAATKPAIDESPRGA